MMLLTDPSKVGTVLLVMASGDWMELQRPRAKAIGKPRRCIHRAQ
jgi:hypothetical protein